MGHTIYSLIVLMLFTVSTQGKPGYVVKWWNDPCLGEYFYFKTEPTYLKAISSDVFICQQTNGINYFITRYSKKYKIPIYSAYKIPSFEKISDKKRYRWRIESELPIALQATRADYHRSGFDRGHLNPRYHNMYSVQSINATFTLTNAVPMTNPSNRKWYLAAEKPLFEKMIRECNITNATRYIVTGVIPSNPSRSIGRSAVNVPEYIWTAACCDTSKTIPLTDSWSIGYFMNTTTRINGSCTIPELGQKLMDSLEHISVRLFEFAFVYSNGHRYRGCNFSDRKRSRS